jgi:hypothetical protein
MEAMTPAAWVFMLVVWSFVGGCTGYCFWKILSSPRRLDADNEQAEEMSGGQSRQPAEQAKPPPNA